MAVRSISEKEVDLLRLRLLELPEGKNQEELLAILENLKSRYDRLLLELAETIYDFEGFSMKVKRKRFIESLLHEQN